MSERFLYLTTTGRKTGLARVIEIWFVEREGRYYMVSQRRRASNWVRNIDADAQVQFSVGTRSDKTEARAATHALGRAVSAHEERALHRAVCALMDEKYGWSDGLVVELEPVEE